MGRFAGKEGGGSAWDGSDEYDTNPSTEDNARNDWENEGQSDGSSAAGGANGSDDDNGKKDNTDEKNENEERKSVAQVLLELVEPYIVELFQDQMNFPYAAVKVDEHIEIIEIPVTHNNSGRLKRWICKTYYENTRKIMANTDAIRAVFNHLAWQADFIGNRKTLDLRVSYGGTSENNNEDGKTIYYDLTNQPRQVIAITRHKWSIKSPNEVPIMFKRQFVQIPQVIPSPSGSYSPKIFDDFMNLLNFKNDSDQRLLLECYIISLFIPRISKAILMLHGPEGAAKSACERIIKLLVDPTSGDLMKLRLREDDIVLQLANNYIVYYDNARDLPDWASDLFCIAATGGTYSKRMLYFDNQEMTFPLSNPIGFNGINLAASSPDILDRGLNIELEKIPEREQVQFDNVIMPKFRKLLPDVLSYIFHIISKVLQFEYDTHGKGLQLETRSRMADWEESCEIISRCLGNRSKDFIKAYRKNRMKKTEVIMEDSPVAQAVDILMVYENLKTIATGNGCGSFYDMNNLGEDKKRLVWTGSPTHLLSALNMVAVDCLNIDIQRNDLWPKNSSVLTKKLMQIKATLGSIGISVERGNSGRGNGKTRSINIVKLASPASPASPGQNSRSNEAKSGDGSRGRNNSGDSSEKMASPESEENHAQNVGGDTGDTGDRSFSTPTENYSDDDYNDNE